MAMAAAPHHHLLLLLSLLCFTVTIPAVMGCIPSERDSLLAFKAGLDDPSGRLSSWVGHGCCRGWAGVRCSNRTGHVVGLDLGNTALQSFDDGPVEFSSPEAALGGGINPSLLGLEHLKHLDLSMNDFQGISIPTFLGSFKGLRYLDLSEAGFGGLVPHQLGNLSSLRYLDLSKLMYMDYHHLYMDSGRWLSHLSSLQYLNLGSVNLSRASSLLESLNGLPSLSQMHLSYCALQHITLNAHANFSSLRALDLSWNLITGSTMPPWPFETTGLEYLDLSYTLFHDSPIPDSIGNLTSLRVLRLIDNIGFIGKIPASLGNLCVLNELDFSFSYSGGNLNELGATFMQSGCIKDSLKSLTWAYSQLTGQLPGWLWGIKNLERLDLSENELNGTISVNLGQLSELVELDLRSNDLEGVISEAHFSNLTRLEELDMSSNSLALDVGTDWSPPPHITSIDCPSCKLGPAFPAWLRQLRNLSFLDLSNAGISDALPGWFWNFSSGIIDIDLSNNDMRGTLPSSLRHLNLRFVDLSNNRLEGPLPQFSSTLQYLYLPNNLLSGAIHLNIGEVVPSIRHLDVGANYINGSIPLSICQLKSLESLILSGNNLFGEIPNCWHHNQGLYDMDLGNNHLTGGIPTSISFLPSFKSLHLNDNDLSGELPRTFRNCTGMQILDLGQNKFRGVIPTWIGDSLPQLESLRLRSNLFVGTIPPQLGNLQHLQVIDLAQNNLSGAIPRTFGNLSSMKNTPNNSYSVPRNSAYDIEVNMKGRKEKYDLLLAYLKSMDLAGNNLTGDVPEELATLSGLQNLNLSGNHLTGKITEKISGLQSLESLDLSFNNLSGAIPTSMASMHYLQVLNLSFNDFSGRIPSGGQLQALPDPSIYIGNHELCGFPLNTECQDNETSQPQQLAKNDESYSEIEEFYLSMGVGYAVGLWTVLGVLLLNKRWRVVYFRFFDDTYDRIYVALAINMAKMKNRCSFHSG